MSNYWLIIMTLSLALMNDVSLHRFNKRVMISQWPDSAARWRGELTRFSCFPDHKGKTLYISLSDLVIWVLTFVCGLISTPWSSRTSTDFAWPLMHAQCRRPNPCNKMLKPVSIINTVKGLWLTVGRIHRLERWVACLVLGLYLATQTSIVAYIV